MQDLTKLEMHIVSFTGKLKLLNVIKLKAYN